jgi:hypothetical protein
MDNRALLSIKSHPDYGTTIDEVIDKEVDENIMNETERRNKRAKALYVILNLSDSYS